MKIARIVPIVFLASSMIFLLIQVSCKKEEEKAEGGDIPSANFSADITSGSASLTINFADQSANSPTSWQWDFGDDSTSVQQNPSHTYISIGTYTVTLKVTNSYGSDTKNKENYITVGGTGDPCPGTPTIYYQGQSYNTVLIGNQCWMKENLNYETEDSWCYDNDPANCDTYGRLYDWTTIMNGEASSNSVPSGVQGICPNGWHLPSDEEWKILEGTVDSHYSVGDSEWDDDSWRGMDVGKRLKTVTGWYSNSGANIYGFSALPAGYRILFGDFSNLSIVAYFWSSTEYSNNGAWNRLLGYGHDGVFREDYNRGNGFSVRCVKD